MSISRLRQSAAGLLVASICALALGPVPALGATVPSGFQDTPVFTGLDEPTGFRFASDGRVFVAEKAGRILVYDGLGDSSPTVFADLTKQVFDKGDRGILGLALDPDFPAHPYVYALYTFDHVLGEDAPGAYPRWGQPPSYVGDDCKVEAPGVDDCPVSGRLVRLTAEGDHAAEKEGAPGVLAEKVLVEDWCQQDSSHSIGDLQFGPEGALFASGGDGASFISSDYGQYGWPHPNQCGDPPGGFGEALEPPDAEGGSLRSLDVLTLEDPITNEDPTGFNGSLIRIDPETGAGLAGNPMASSPDVNARKIVAFGFRNPFRFAINPQTEKVFVDNVGNGTDEEIDRFPLAPAQPYNSGWPCYEGVGPNPGFQFLELSLCEGLYDAPASTSKPFFYYDHYAGVTPEDGCPSYNGSAISGSAFYDGGAFPSAYDGAFFFTDSVRGCIYVMQADEDGEPDPLTTTTFLVGDLNSYPGIDIEVGPGGDLYYSTLYGDESGEGSIERISYDPGAPVARLSVDRRWGPLNLEVNFDASGSTAADEDPLEYEWDFDGDGTFEVQGAALQKKVFKTAQNRTVAVEVTDEETEKSSIAELTVYPGDSPPQVQISEPSGGLTWGVGQEIDFAGVAKAEEGSGPKLPAARLYWKARLRHCPFESGACHLHPLQVFPAVDSGSLVAPDHDYPSGIELTLTAADSRGLAASRTVELEPRSVDLEIGSKPAGVTLTAGLLTEPGPFVLTAIEGGSVALSAPQAAKLAGVDYVFSGWSDGGPRSHTIEASGSPSKYVVTYVREFPGGEEPPGGGGDQPDGAVGQAGAATGGDPQTAITRHPKRRTSRTSASFAFSADVGGASFRCKLDERAFRPCASPWSYRHLAPGAHVFRVVAVTTGGRIDPTPTVFRWRISRGAR